MMSGFFVSGVLLKKFQLMRLPKYMFFGKLVIIYSYLSSLAHRPSYIAGTCRGMMSTEVSSVFLWVFIDKLMD
ncbi:MAG TPA: hypothetical protein DIC30_05125 [Oceanospirillales bacterium]|nr:hypothetical protein [Oceanospirillales bacterium]|tara:strand:- start:11569 stop:11787 length:219 start_codon:yes stop_codon:yes gene_type:complete